MIIEYTPEGAEQQRFDAGRLRASEIQIVERTADGRWGEIKEAMSEGDINAMRTIAFVLKKRNEPSLRLADFDPFEDELRVRLDARETRAYAQQLFEKYQADPDDLAAAFSELRDATADSEACEQAIADVTAPKDPAPPQDEASSASPSES